jgi:hypothetical protein
MNRTPTKQREMESIFNAPKKQKREPTYLFDNAPVADLNANALTEELEFNIVKHKNQDGTYQDYDVVEGSEDPISIQEIQDGDTIGIVDKDDARKKTIYIYSNLAEIFFHNTENPFTREQVYRIDVYKARIVPAHQAGGKKYKKTQTTKKTKGSKKNTKKHSKK